MTGYRSLGAPLLALSLLLAPIQGCYKVLIFPYKTCFSPQIDANIIKLERELEQIEARYDKEVESTRGYINTRKERVEELLSAGDHAGALKELDGLWVVTHPCEVHDCDKLRGEAEDPTRVSEYVKDHDLLDRANISREDRFIKSSLKAILSTARAQLERGEYDAVDQGLSPTHALKLNYRVKQELAALHGSAKTAWVEDSEARAQALSQTLPAAAYLHHMQAARLATQLKDEPRATRNLAAAQRLRDAVLEGRKLLVAPVEVSDEGAQRVIAGVGELRPYAAVARGGGAGQEVSLSLSLGAPTFRREERAGEKSFSYISGSRTVTNPDYVAAKDFCDRRTREHEQELFKCRDPDHSCRDFVTEDFMDEACAKVRQHSPTTQEDEFSDYPYPITIHVLQGAQPFVATIKDERGGVLREEREGTAIEIQDIEHEAYSMRGAGVARDPAAPPTEAQGVDALQKRSSKRLSELINLVADAYRAGLIERASSSPDAALDALVTYALLDPATTSKEVFTRIEAAAKLSDARALF